MPLNPIVVPPRQARPKRRRSRLLRFAGFAFTTGGILFVVAAAAAAYVLWQITQDLPSYAKLNTYEPKVITRLHASDGTLISEYAEERRLYVPINAIPQKVIDGFLAAEDKNFYEHKGIDMTGVIRAIVSNLQALGTGKRPEGASTITQQVAKNFLLSSEQSYKRKIKEAILAVRIERAFSKDRILELYLNEIYLGMGSYGVAAAALNYFGKELADLQPHEIGYLAALPKAPNNYHPIKHRERATSRRNWVIDRMADNGHITRAEAETAKAVPLRLTPRPDAQVAAADFFAEETRRALVDIFGETKVYAGGLSVRTTLDPKLQAMARQSLRDGLVRYDRRQGFRGPVSQIDIAGDWGKALAAVPGLADVAPWRLAVVLEAGKDAATLGLQPDRGQAGELTEVRKTVRVPLSELLWAQRVEKGAGGRKIGKKPAAATDVLAAGDVVYVAPSGKTPVDEDAPKPAVATPAAADAWSLQQVPEIEGAITVMDPHTGRVLALVGGFSYAASQFDRAVQAKRQPGSAFKPIVYAAALDNGYTPSSIVLDAPLAIEQGGTQGLWKPENYEEGKFYGPSTLRLGLEKSRNLMTIRLAQDLGMPVIEEYSRRFGVYDKLSDLLSMSLGAGETTLLRMTQAYSSFVNGGKRVEATLIDRIQDRYGASVWKHDGRKCEACEATAWANQDEPTLPDGRQQIIDTHTAYQVTSMLEGVVKRGTGYKIAKLGRPLAGKTGTTNDEKDAWFVGFSPDLTVGVFIGYDNPAPMGRGETGGSIAAPVFRDFMAMAMAGKPAMPFRVPDGIKLVRIDAKTGMRTDNPEGKTLIEAFKPNEEPPDSYSYVTYGSGGESATAAADGQGGQGGWGTEDTPPPRGREGYAGRPAYDDRAQGDGGYAERPYARPRQPQAGGLY